MVNAQDVTIFIDWNNQLLALPDRRSFNDQDRARLCLIRVARTVSRVLDEEGPTKRYRVSLRLYCGWTRGGRRTPYYNALVGQRSLFDVAGLFPSERITVRDDIAFGDRLIDALPEREHAALGIHLVDTLRSRNGTWTEKMVDTAMASDILSVARSNPNTLVLVVSSDDDLVPPIFVAEAWMRPVGGRVFLVRSPRASALKLQNLTKDPGVTND